MKIKKKRSGMAQLKNLVWFYQSNFVDHSRDFAVPQKCRISRPHGWKNSFRKEFFHLQRNFIEMKPFIHWTVKSFCCQVKHESWWVKKFERRWKTCPMRTWKALINICQRGEGAPQKQRSRVRILTSFKFVFKSPCLVMEWCPRLSPWIAKSQGLKV